MYRHLLITVDGSPLSDSVFQRSIVFAKEMNAAVTVLRAIPEDHLLVYQAEMLGTAQATTPTRRARTRRPTWTGWRRRPAMRWCPAPAWWRSTTTRTPPSSTPPRRRAAIIIMGSHGRHGMTGFLLGSETQRVLAQTAAGAGAAPVCSPAIRPPACARHQAPAGTRPPRRRQPASASTRKKPTV